MKLYRAPGPPPGSPTGSPVPVLVEFTGGDPPRRPGYRLHHVVRLAPLGFDWGHDGPGARDLALSLLSDALADLGEEEVADLVVAAFVGQFIGRLDREGGWELREADIWAWFQDWKLAHPRLAQAHRQRILWALGQTGHPGDRGLVTKIYDDFAATPRVIGLASVWDISKLEIAAFVWEWMTRWPSDVEETRQAFPDWDAPPGPPLPLTDPTSRKPGTLKLLLSME